MKYLYYSPFTEPTQIKLTDKENNVYTADDEYTIEELFKMKDKYQKIEIKQCGLYYKENKKRYQLKGWVNIKEYEKGGTWQSLTIKEQLEQLKQNLQ